MNLSEALDAALPEIPRDRITLARPPRLDPELIVREDTLEGDPIVGVFQRSKGNYFRFAPAQWKLASLFDGVRSYEDIGEEFERKTGAPMPADAVRVFAQNMDESDFWYKSTQERNIAFNEKLQEQRKRQAHRKSNINVAHISFSAWDPDAYFTWLDAKVGRFVYSRWCVLAVVILFAFEGIVMISKWNVIGPDIPLYYNFTRKGVADLARFWLLFLFLGFFHESSHGLTCKHYGGQVHRMGLMLIYLTPAFFVDVTEIWISATKLQRLATIVAGIWVELVFCGLAMIVWTNTQPGQWAHDFSYELILITGLAVIVINFNPLIKLDGYYFFTELIGIPDLKERSTAFLSGWIQRRLLGLQVDLPAVSRRRAPLFALYAFCSGLYSYLLLFAVVRFTYRVAFTWLDAFAILPAGALALTVFSSRIKALRRVLSRVWSERVLNADRPRPAAWFGAFVVLALCFAPIVRIRQTAYYVVEPDHTLVLHAAADGRVLQVAAREGETVATGQDLVHLQSATLDSLRDSVDAQGTTVRLDALEAAMAQRPVGSASAALEHASKLNDLAGAERARLLVHAPESGTILTQDPAALKGQNVAAGQDLLRIAAAGPHLVRLFIPAVSLQELTQHPAVLLLLPGDFRPMRLSLPEIGGDPVKLPPGILPASDYSGVILPTFYSARLTLPPQVADAPLGASGEAVLLGPHRSLAQRAIKVMRNVLRSNVW
jgi:putative peptide zinc metalloprotease protein